MLSVQAGVAKYPVTCALIGKLLDYCESLFNSFWSYGCDLFDYLKYPVDSYIAISLIYILIHTGLIATDWGGTAIELWSSPDSLANCGVNIAIIFV